MERYVYLISNTNFCIIFKIFKLIIKQKTAHYSFKRSLRLLSKVQNNKPTQSVSNYFLTLLKEIVEVSLERIKI